MRYSYLTDTKNLSVVINITANVHPLNSIYKHIMHSKLNNICVVRYKCEVKIRSVNVKFLTERC